MLKKNNSIINMIGVYLSIIIFCAAMVLITINMKSLFHNDNIAQIPVQVMIAILSGALGGAFTLLGVDRTLNKQKEMNFIKEFPLKIFYLDELINGLDELKKQIYKENAPFLFLKERAIGSLITTSTEVDGYIYFKVRESNEIFSKLIKENFFDQDKKLFVKNEMGEWIQIEGKEDQVTNMLSNLNKVVEDLNEIFINYREAFVNYYNKNIEGSIYQKIV